MPDQESHSDVSSCFLGRKYWRKLVQVPRKKFVSQHKTYLVVVLCSSLNSFHNDVEKIYKQTLIFFLYSVFTFESLISNVFKVINLWITKKLLLVFLGLDMHRIESKRGIIRPVIVCCKQLCVFNLRTLVTFFSTYMELLRSVGVLFIFLIERFFVIIVAAISRLCAKHTRVIHLYEVSKRPISLFAAFWTD